MRKILLILLLTPAALAHEFWLETPRLRLAPGDTVPLRLLVGEDFAGQPWPGRATKIGRLVRYGPAPADSTALAPADSLRLTLARPGLHTVVLQSTESFAELPAAAFTQYLQTEGLDFILDKRREAGTAQQPGREAYRRVAKTLLQAGDPARLPPPADTAALRPHGLPLELVAEQNPYRLAAGRNLTLRLLRAGRPVRGGRVQVWQRQPGGLPTTHFSTRTNSAGRFMVKLLGPGPYLVAAVGMEPAPAALRPRADWYSTWASLTFGGPPAAPAR